MPGARSGVPRPSGRTAPPHSHSHVQPPPGRRVTRGWWCAEGSGWIRRRVVVVIELPFVVGGFAAPRPSDVLTDDDAVRRLPRLCAPRHPGCVHGHARGHTPRRACSGPRQTSDRCRERRCRAALGPRTEERREVVATMRRHSYGAGEVVSMRVMPRTPCTSSSRDGVVGRRCPRERDRLAYAVMGGPGFRGARDDRAWGPAHGDDRDRRTDRDPGLRFADFERLCVRRPEVSRLLVRLLAARVNRLTEALMEALHTPASSAFVRSLVSLCGVYSAGRAKAFARGRGAEQDRDRRARRGDPTDRPTGSCVVSRPAAWSHSIADASPSSTLWRCAARPLAGSGGTWPRGIPALGAGSSHPGL